MLVLDFPPEIFKDIMHYLVPGFGVAEAWKLRGISRTFDHEISENVLSVQPRAVFRDPVAHRILSHKENLKYFLAYHMKKPGGILPQIPAKIQNMADYLKEELEEDVYKHQEVLMNLCGRFSQALKSLSLTLWDPLTPVASAITEDGYRDLRLRNQLSLDGDLTYCDKTIAAMSVQAYGLIKNLLNEVSDQPSGHTLRLPMAVAAKFNDLEAIKTFMDYLRLSRYKRYQKREASSFNSVFGIPPAIEVALDLGHHTLLSSLLNDLNLFTKSFSQPQYRDWIRQAVNEGQVECLRALVSQIPVKSSFRVTIDTIDRVCKSGKAEMMTAILENGCMPIYGDTTTYSPLAIAIRHPNMAAVGAVLDAGADMNISMSANHIVGINYITPFEYAIHIRKYSAVAYLIERGAKVPRVNREALPPKLRSIFHKAVVKRKANRSASSS